MTKNAPSRKRPRLSPWIAVVAVAALAGYALLSKSTSNATSPLKPTVPEAAGVAPAFTLTDLSGKMVSLSDFRGKVVVLDFWATWCPPCKMEIPDFISLQKEYASQGLQIVGIALDEPDKVQAFARENGMNYPVLLGDGEIARKYGGIEGIPTTFIIDKSGRIADTFVGFRPKKTFEQEIKKLL